MGKTDEAWEEVGSHFTRLGRRFRENYAAREGKGEVGPDVKDAFKGLVDAAERVASTIGDTVRDEDVRSEAKAAANSFVEALGTTFSEVGDELRKVFTTKTEDEPTTEAEDESTAEAAREVAEAAGDVMPDEEEEDSSEGA